MEGEISKRDQIQAGFEHHTVEFGFHCEALEETCKVTCVCVCVCVCVCSGVWEVWRWGGELCSNLCEGAVWEAQGCAGKSVSLSLPTRVDSSLSERIPEMDGTNWRVRAVVARKAAQGDPCLIWSVLGSE